MCPLTGQSVQVIPYIHNRLVWFQIMALDLRKLHSEGYGVFAEGYFIRKSPKYRVIDRARSERGLQLRMVKVDLDGSS